MNGEAASLPPEEPTPPEVDAHGEFEAALGDVIAERVRSYRRGQQMTIGQLATRCGLSKGMLSKIENAQTSPSLATLARLSAALAVPVTAFFRGLDEEQDVLFVKAGSGLDIHHQAGLGQRYELLGSLRAPHDILEPLVVTLTEPTEEFPLYQHSGSELIYMLEGQMEYGYGGSRFLLEPGDALQFSGEATHGPAEMVELPIRFLSVKARGAERGEGSP